VTTRDGPVRVILVDDLPIAHAALRAALANAPDVTVIGAAPRGDKALALVGRSAPQVVLIGLDARGDDATTITRAIWAMDPAPKVLILGMQPEEECLIPLLKAGASGYLAKNVSATELIEAIRVVASGDVYVRPCAARMLAASMRPRSTPDVRRQAFGTLSNRERTVVRMIAEGHSGREIAQQLGISAKTVDKFKERIRAKLSIAHRTEYVRLALDLELLR
jgi:DNA-binding NarL/FixJ family response regulator